AQTSRRRQPLLLSGGLMILGGALLWRIAFIPGWELVIGVAAVSLGYSIANVVLQQGVIESVPSRFTGTIAGTYMLLRYLGAIISAPLLASALGTLTGSERLFALLALLSFIAWALSWGLPRSARPAAMS
ncbi:MAG: hypothetical protein OWS74_00575, partial [Firmicutes bacterium]|nr:hypothetical protein [Bacillota bacterium]